MIRMRASAKIAMYSPQTASVGNMEANHVEGSSGLNATPPVPPPGAPPRFAGTPCPMREASNGRGSVTHALGWFVPQTPPQSALKPVSTSPTLARVYPSRSPLCTTCPVQLDPWQGVMEGAISMCCTYQSCNPYPGWLICVVTTPYPGLPLSGVYRFALCKKLPAPTIVPSASAYMGVPPAEVMSTPPSIALHGLFHLPYMPTLGLSSHACISFNQVGDHVAIRVP